MLINKLAWKEGNFPQQFYSLFGLKYTVDPLIAKYVCFTYLIYSWLIMLATGMSNTRRQEH